MDEGGDGVDEGRDGLTHCCLLDSSVVVTQNWYRLSKEESESFLNHTPSSPSPSSPPSVRWVLWLDIEMQLVNGSSYHLTSERTPLQLPNPCAANTTGKGVLMLKIDRPPPQLAG